MSRSRVVSATTAELAAAEIRVQPRYTARQVLYDLRNYRPFPWQSQLHTAIPQGRPGTNDPRFFPANVGRGAGKTTCAPEIAWEGATEEWDDGLGPPHVKLFADTYEHGRIIWDVLWQEALGVLAPLIHSTDKERNIITLRDADGRPAGTLQLLSADSEKAMTGHNKTTLGLADECQFIKDSAWMQFRPCLNIRRAKFVGFGVCEGQNWYRTVSLRGYDSEEWPEYLTLRFPSTANPYFGPDSDELAQREYTQDQYRNLFLAEWTNTEGAVFENIDNCIVNAGVVLPLPNGTPLVLEEPKPGKTYTAGLDIAKKRDFMALTIWDRSTGRLVAAFRANKRTYTFLEASVASLLTRYHPMTYVDITGMGEAVYEHVRKIVFDHYNNWPKDQPRPDRFTAFYPVELQTRERDATLDGLALALIQERIRFAHVKPLVNELRVFEKTVLPSGSIRMAAPEGLHDDMVFSAALGVRGLPPSPVLAPSLAASTRRVAGWEKLR